VKLAGTPTPDLVILDCQPTGNLILAPSWRNLSWRNLN
jgi:hypothetical protein